MSVKILMSTIKVRYKKYELDDAIADMARNKKT